MSGRPHPNWALLNQLTAAWADPKLTLAEKMVLNVLWIHCDDQGATFVSQETIAEELGLSRSSRSQVSRGLRHLTDQGWIEVVERGVARGRSTVHRLFPAVETRVPSSLVEPPEPVSPSDGLDPEPVCEPVFQPVSQLVAPPHPKTRKTMKTKQQRVAQLFVIPSEATNGRAPDRLFEAVAEACGIDWHRMTQSERGRLNRAVKELREVDAEPDEVLERVLRLRLRWRGEIAITPKNLVDHWSSLCPEFDQHPATRDLDSDTVANYRAIEKAQARRNGHAITNGNHP